MGIIGTVLLIIGFLVSLAFIVLVVAVAERPDVQQHDY